MTAPGAKAPTPCEYERDGRACGKWARVRLTIRDMNAPPSISGEPVRFKAHACYECAARQRKSLPEGLKVEEVEPL